MLVLVCYTSVAQNATDAGKIAMPATVSLLQDSVLSTSKGKIVGRTLTPDSLSTVPDSIKTSPKDSVAVDTVKKSTPVVLEDPIAYNATDSIVMSLDAKKVYLYKNAVVTYQDIELKADYIQLDLNAKEVYAEGLPDTTGVMQGEPVFTQGSDKYESRTMRYNFKSGKGIIQDVRTQQGEGYVEGERTKKVGKNVFIMKNGKYTTCDKEHPDFYLMMTKAKVIANKTIVTGPAYMVLEDFPIYFPFLPFGFFPSSPTYSSGIIIPSYGEETNRGFFLREGGYYWAASPYYDLTLKGDIYSKGSWATYISSNYKKRYKFSGSFNFSYNVNKYGESGASDAYKTKGFSIKWSHSQDSKANPYQSFSASVNLSTSSYDKENSNDYESYLSTTKSSSISYSKKWENTPFSMSVNLTHSQNSSDSIMSLSLPVMTFTMTKIYPFRAKQRSGALKWYEKIGFSYTGNIKNTISAREDSILKKSLLKDWSNGWKHNTSISLPSFNLLKYINVTPSVSYTERWYTHKLNERYYFDQISRTSTVDVDTLYGFKRNYQYSFSLSSSTTIYGMYVIKNPNSSLKVIRHKITPSVSFSYQPDFGAPKYGFWGSYVDHDGDEVFYNRYKDGVYGSAGRGKSESMSFSVTNTLEAKVLAKSNAEKSGAQSREIMNTAQNDTASSDKYKTVKILDNLGFSGSYNFVADTMKLSTIALRARTTIRGVSFNFSGTLDPYMADSTGSRYNEFCWNQRNGIGKLGRLTSASFSFGMSFKSKQGNSGQPQQQGGGQEQQSPSLQPGQPPVQPVVNTMNGPEYYDFNIPWNLNFNYSLSYSHSNPYKKPTISQSLNVSGNMSLTDKWKMRMTTNFDIDAGTFSYTTFNVSRSLHCFNMSFSFVPFGTRRSYSFTINASSSMLKDLKLDKKKSWYDN